MAETRTGLARQEVVDVAKRLLLTIDCSQLGRNCNCCRGGFIDIWKIEEKGFMAVETAYVYVCSQSRFTRPKGAPCRSPVLEQ